MSKYAHEKQQCLSALERLAVWTYNEPCWCDACNNRTGTPEHHRHTQECDQARIAWNYLKMSLGDTCQQSPATA